MCRLCKGKPFVVTVVVSERKMTVRPSPRAGLRYRRALSVTRLHVVLGSDPLPSVSGGERHGSHAPHRTLGHACGGLRPLTSQFLPACFFQPQRSEDRGIAHILGYLGR